MRLVTRPASRMMRRWWEKVDLLSSSPASCLTWAHHDSPWRGGRRGVQGRRAPLTTPFTPVSAGPHPGRLGPGWLAAGQSGRGDDDLEGRVLGCVLEDVVGLVHLG